MCASSDSAKAAIDDTSDSKPTGFGLSSVQITGEGGSGFFQMGSEGAFPNAEFRVDEAKVFIDAPVRGNAYAFAELNLATHESSDLDLKGTCKLKAWHERLPAQSKEITVPEQGELKMDFVLGITNLPKY